MLVLMIGGYATRGKGRAGQGSDGHDQRSEEEQIGYRGLS